MPADLVAYLRARVDEDEATATAASPGPWLVKDLGDAEFTSSDNCGWWWVWQESKLPHYGGVIQIDHTPGAVGVASITDAEQGAKERADADHIARWNPAAVLADIAAKRALLEMHVREKYRSANQPDYCRECAQYDKYEDPTTGWPCATLLALAQAHAARDDFDPSWRTDA